MVYIHDHVTARHNIKLQFLPRNALLSLSTRHEPHWTLTWFPTPGYRVYCLQYLLNRAILLTSRRRLINYCVTREPNLRITHWRRYVQFESWFGSAQRLSCDDVWTSNISVKPGNEDYTHLEFTVHDVIFDKHTWPIWPWRWELGKYDVSWHLEQPRPIISVCR